MYRSKSLGLGLLLLFGLPALAQTDARSGADGPQGEFVGIGWVAPTIIDTRTIQPQIQGGWPWTGPIENVHDHLPPHYNDRVLPLGAPNQLLVGGLLDLPRVLTGEGYTFPGIQQTRYSPPDLTIGVGPNHVIATVNATLAFFSKTGTLEFSIVLDNTGNPGFFEEVGALNFVVDPKCFYDHIARRYVVLAIEVYFGSSAWLDVAVSDDDDPHGVWYKYRTPAEIPVGQGIYWVDYPSCGYDAQAIYTGGNLFLLKGSGGQTAGILFRVYDKAPMLGGNPTTYADLRDGAHFSGQAGHHFGANQAAFYAGVDTTSSIRIYAIKDPLGTPTLDSAAVTVPAFVPSSRNSAPNNGGMVDPLDGRVFNVHWRNGHLYTGHPINVGGVNKARWYHFDTGDWPNSGTPTLVESGNVDAGPNIHTYYPTLWENRRGDVGMVLARSATNEYVSVQITGRHRSDPAGTMGQLRQLYIGDRTASGRWGDYYGITTDPTDDFTFWCVGQYQSVGGWGSWIESFTVGGKLGDANCDGIVNNFDIDPFTLALSDPVGYKNAYPNCDILNADANMDGVVDNFDIDPFVKLLTP